MFSRFAPNALAAFTRRQWLRGGGALAAATLLPDVLKARAATREAARPDAPAKSVIIIYLQGGLSHYESFDPKPDAPSAYRGEFKPAATSLPGVHFCEHMPLLSARAHKFNTLRSVYVDSPSHPEAIHMTLTGWDLPGADVAGKNRNRTNPALGSWVAHLADPGRSGLPAYVAIPHAGQLGIRVQYATSGALGPTCEPVWSGLPPATADGSYEPPRDLRLQRELAAARVSERLNLLAALDHGRASTEQLAGLDKFHRQAYDLLAADAAGAAFDLNREPAALREKYGSHLFGQQTILARRLAEAGVSVTLVNYTLTQHHGQDWDTHVNNFGLMRDVLLPPMDRAVSTLLDDLEERGLLDTTLVAMYGEFGRTPQINAQAGRDHWEKVCSVMLAGGGLKRGIVLGSSTKAGDLPLDRPIHFNDVLATIYRQLGLTAEAEILDQTGRPIAMLPKGEAIRELI